MFGWEKSPRTNKGSYAGANNKRRHMQQASHDMRCIGLGNRLDDPLPALLELTQAHFSHGMREIRSLAGMGWSEVEVSTN